MWRFFMEVIYFYGKLPILQCLRKEPSSAGGHMCTIKVPGAAGFSVSWP
jgi:hypothetical protein